jgi:hypothetical protein
MDIRFVKFCQWLFSNPSSAPAVSAHVLASAFLPGLIKANGKFSPTVVVSDGADTSRPGYSYTSNPLTWATAPPTLAVQALGAAQDFDWLTSSVLHYGPNCSPADVAAAITASGL